jgi:hypothetical protein
MAIKNKMILNWMIGIKRVIKMLRKAMLIMFVLLTHQVRAADKVTMVCDWVLFFPEQDAFIFDIANKTVSWVEEDLVLKLTVKEGLLEFSGVPKSRVQVDKNKYKTHIPIQFTLNRITGVLKVKKEYGDGNPFAKCRLKERIL